MTSGRTTRAAGLPRGPAQMAQMGQVAQMISTVSMALMASMASIAPSLLAALLAIGAAGCGRGDLPAGYGEVADLAAELPAAGIHREVPAIDIGTPEARPHLVSGWSWDESAPDGGTFAWGVGEASEVRFFLVAPRDLTLRLRGRPFEVPSTQNQTQERARSQTLAIEVNGRPVQQLAMEPGTRTYSVPLPAAALAAGDNRLTLRYGRALSPRELGLSSDDRALAAAWEGLRLDPVAAGADGAEAPSVVAGGPRGPKRSGGAPGEAEARARLRLPFGTGVDFFLEIPDPRAGAGSGLAWAGPALVFDALRVEGAGWLAVEIQEEGQEPIVAGRLERAAGHTVFRLPIGAGAPGARLLRLGLRAVPGTPGAAGALELVEPHLLARGAGPARPDDSAEMAGPAGLATDEPSSDRATTGRTNVLVYLVDTLRADRLGAYGDGRGLTPAIDAFAAEGVVFEDTVAQAPWTRPAVATLLTGLEPLAHGVTTLDDRLAEEAETLPEILRRAGYRTAAFSTNWHVIPETGLAQGFDDFVFTPDDFHADAVNRRVLAWLDEHGASSTAPDREEPFFLYVHTLDPHAPYEPPEPFRSRFAPGAPPDAGSRELLKRIYAATAPEQRDQRARMMATVRDLYDGEVAFTDHAFGDLLEALRERGLYDETLIVFVSDHGEELDEHGHLGHGYDLYREVLQVPFIVRLPGGERPGGRARVAETVQQTDLLPTLLGRLGVEAPAELRDRLPGVDLFAPLASSQTARPAFSHLDYEGRRALAVTLGRWRATVPLSADYGRWTTLFDRSRDPAELDDLAESAGGPGRLPVRAGYLETLVRRHLLAAGKGSLAEAATLDDETKKGLEALGYL